MNFIKNIKFNKYFKQLELNQPNILPLGLVEFIIE